MADGLNPVLDEEIATVNSILEDIGADKKPIIVAVNKIDKSGHDSIFVRGYEKSTIGISALTGKNIDKLLKAICDVLPSNRKQAELFIPYEDGNA